MSAREEQEKMRVEYREMYPSYDRWAGVKWRWWKKADKPRVPDFSGTGKEFKWPAINPTGHMTIPAMAQDDRIKIINNTWRNCFFMQWHVLQEELGAEKAAQCIGYMWIAQITAMEGLNERYWPEQKRDCVMLSKLMQIDMLYEMFDYDNAEESPNRSVHRLLCTYWADWKHRWEAKGIDIRKGLCDMGCKIWCEECALMINPNMTCERTKWMVEGAPYCEYVFEIKEEK